MHSQSHILTFKPNPLQEVVRHFRWYLPKTVIVSKTLQRTKHVIEITHQWLMLVQHQHKLSQRPVLPRLLSRHPRALWATRARRLCRSYRARLAHRIKTRAARGSRRSRSRVRRLRRRRCLHRSLGLRQARDCRRRCRLRLGLRLLLRSLGHRILYWLCESDLERGPFVYGRARLGHSNI